MAEPTREIVPAAMAGWVCRQQSCQLENCQQCRALVADEVLKLAKRLVVEVSDVPRRDSIDTNQQYASRLWTCLEYHWLRLSESDAIGFTELADRLESGRLGFERLSSNVLFEVMLAQAMENRQQKAAEMFQALYMPFVTLITRQLRCQKAVDAFDNFTAELTLPRNGRPPRIASYQGRTSLKSWLRSVVAHFWINRNRRDEPATMETLPERIVPNDSTARTDQQPCIKMLYPLIQRVVSGLATEDRLLMKMLLVDEVSQKELARSIGVHSGSLTRRKQRIAEGIWPKLVQLAQSTGHKRHAEECLEVVLADGDRTLSQQLGEVLSQALGDAKRPLEMMP